MIIHIRDVQNLGKDENFELLDDIVVVSVLTCVAPKVFNGKERMSEAAYRKFVYDRIVGMPKSSALFGYRNFVLSAWDCGGYRNDASAISDLF